MDYVTVRENCGIEYTLKFLGSKWTFLILRELFTGTKRFGELRHSLKSISTKTLIERLRDLEDDHIVERKIYPEVPPRVEYTLTERGQSLEPILQAMRDWAANGDPEKPERPSDK
jgi:DNA-binding HxlR family transcriptional regulator